MRVRKHEREQKRQRGQYMTPRSLAKEIVSSIELEGVSRILEPSCGDGAFLEAICNRLNKDATNKPDGQKRTLIAVEIDADLAEASSGVAQLLCSDTSDISGKVIKEDFFRIYLDQGTRSYTNDDRGLCKNSFDLIIGNPPFGGTFDHLIEEELDKYLGNRFDRKIKKETYAFFIIACIDLLRDGGKLVFVCSDTLLTIPTMTGLRNYLMETGSVSMRDLSEFSLETNYPMLVIEYTKGREHGVVRRGNSRVSPTAIHSTPNLSWGITPKLSKLFTGSFLGDFFVASSGMTTGKNEYFVRGISPNGSLEEPFKFEYVEEPITLAYELERARLGKISNKKREKIKQAEQAGETQRRLRVVPRIEPQHIKLPDARYKPYNKASSSVIYSPPTHAIYWENNGEAVLTYKKTGNWYLHGVGGQPYFEREGLTWQLIASRFVPRYLPSGYILDSGAPCAFPRKGVDTNEIYFVIAWLLSPLSKEILKTVINHTRNIQSKDFERMPYPWWVDEQTKQKTIEQVKTLIEDAKNGLILQWTDEAVTRIGKVFEVPKMFQYDSKLSQIVSAQRQSNKTPSLFDMAHSGSR